MYEPLLFIHSWTRWAVFIGAIYFLIHSALCQLRGFPWSSRDSHFLWAYNQAFGYQVCFGITLWLAFSPITKAGMRDSSLILKNPIVTFWFLRHPLTMIFALGIFHLGKAKIRRAPIQTRFMISSATFAMILALFISAIPWPRLEYGRALFRWFS